MAYPRFLTTAAGFAVQASSAVGDIIRSLRQEELGLLLSAQQIMGVAARPLIGLPCEGSLRLVLRQASWQCGTALGRLHQAR